MGAQVRRAAQAYSQPLFGRGPGGGKDSHSRQWRLSMAVFLNRNKRPQAAPIEVAELLLEKPSPSQYPIVSLSRTVAAALSAAVTTTKQQETAPTLHGRTSPKERTSLFPATLRERGSGGEALLLEKRPLPQRSPIPVFSGGSAREGTFLQEKSPPSHPITPNT